MINMLAINPRINTMLLLTVELFSNNAANLLNLRNKQP